MHSQAGGGRLRSDVAARASHVMGPCLADEPAEGTVEGVGVFTGGWQWEERSMGAVESLVDHCGQVAGTVRIVDYIFVTRKYPPDCLDFISRV